jgi:glycosyltransferase involved in cell wall biosynthesis
MKIGVANFSLELSIVELESLQHFYLFAKLQPTVFFTRKKSFLESELQQIALKTKKNIPIKVESFSYEKTWSPFLILNLREKVIKNKIEVMLFFNLEEGTFISLALKGLPVKLVLRGNFSRAIKKNDWLNNYIYERIDGIVSTSQYGAAQLQSQSSNQEHFPMIYNPMSFDSYSIQESFEDKNKYIREKNKFLEILHIGDIHDEYGQFEALHAANYLKEKGFHFKVTFVGEFVDSSYYQKILHFIKEHNLSSYVVFVGEHQNLNYFYQKSHILLAPFYDSSKIQIYLDALAHGLPLLAYENSTFLEFRLLGFNIFLFENKDIRSYCKKLEHMAYNIKPILRNSLDNNLSVAIEYFSSEVVAKQWINYFRSLLDQRNNGFRNGLNFKVS